MSESNLIPARAWHHPHRHAAVRTTEYIYSQLIPYLGNKRKLLPLIARALIQTNCRKGTFVDLFSGSTVVARLAKSLGYRVIANDWEPYSYEIARTTVALNRVPLFASLGGAQKVFQFLNSLAPCHGYIAQHYCPRDDDYPNEDNERMFFTRRNGEQIDAIREQVAAWESSEEISTEERAFILCALVYSVSYVSNTSGVFKGFHRGWGGKTGTALYRIRSRMQLAPPLIFDNEQNNMALREDAQRLAANFRSLLGEPANIVYLDPPYNQHPYGSNYHLLNTIVLWDKPPLSPSIRINGIIVDKSAIRKDWRVERRSPYNSATQSLTAFKELINRLDARWIIVSYSTDGNIPLDGLLTTLARRGDLQVFVQKYKRYRVSTPRMSPRSHNTEFVGVVDTHGKATSRIEELIEIVTTGTER